MIKIAPSILAADPLNLEKDIKAAEKAGCDWIHVDIMDAHFVPNLAYSVDTVRRLREITSLPLDVHLMMDHPETLLDAFLDAGASCVTIHAEIDADIPGMLTKIRNRGRMAGIALKPGTEPEMIYPYIDLTDLVLMMTVEPGFGGQSMMPDCLDKIAVIKAECASRGLQIPVMIDGGVNASNVRRAAEAGADMMVAGNAVFGATDRAAAFRELSERSEL